MEWLVLVVVCAALFATGYARPRWWALVAPLLLTLTAYVRAQMVHGTDSDGVPLRGWESLARFSCCWP